MNRSTCTGRCLALARGTRRTHTFFAARLPPSMIPCAAAARVTPAGYLLLQWSPMRPPPYLLCPRGPPSRPRTLRAGWWALRPRPITSS
jgi:hypothetical protein